MAEPTSTEQNAIEIASLKAMVAKLSKGVACNTMSPAPTGCGTSKTVYSEEWVCKELRLLREALNTALRCGCACIDEVPDWSFPALGAEADIPVMNGMMYAGVSCIIVKDAIGGGSGIFQIVDVSAKCLTVTPAANGDYQIGDSVACATVCALPYCPLPQAVVPPPPVITIAAGSDCVKITGGPVDGSTTGDANYVVSVDAECVCEACTPTCDTRVCGVVYEDSNLSGALDEPQAQWGVENAIVNATGPGGTFNATTDAEGNYEFLNMPPGTYQVCVDLESTNFGSTTSAECLDVTIACEDDECGFNFGLKPNATPITIDTLCYDADNNQVQLTTGSEVDIIGYEVACVTQDQEIIISQFYDSTGGGTGDSYLMDLNQTCNGTLFLRVTDSSLSIEAYEITQECE